MTVHGFDLLTPHLVVEAVEAAYGLRLDGTLTNYPSYVNRVYGLTDEDESHYVVKFYRPGRWSAEAILEEHRFLRDCAEAELPVVTPVADTEGETLQTATAVGEDIEQDYEFALFPRRSGRSFDADYDEDWLRLGSLVGRVHVVARAGQATRRLRCRPQDSTSLFLRELRVAEVVHPECRGEFFDLAEEALQLITPLFAATRLRRIHGDCHRGNILDRADQGLLIIDFDDMMMGPATQDLWLLLPGRAVDCQRELALILAGYEEFCAIDPVELRLIEPLRLMRMLYYLAWSARQRHDRGFREAFPQWGGKAFWLQEIEDLRTQIEVIDEDLHR
jgi:Ser/Thr protein kinase RdoA (MazF antagonist)